ncbi:capsular polysaccharide export protein, LipB/KpsS family [Halovulum sp. GXIMD14793]
MQFLRFEHDRFACLANALGADCKVAQAGRAHGFQALRRQHGLFGALGRCISAVISPAKNPDFPLTAGNILRKRIRLPWLRYVPLLLPLYARAKSLSATLSGAAISAALADHPDLIVLIWNGSIHPETAVAERCRRMGRKTLFLEQGFFPDTLQANPKGINALSSLPREKEFYLNWTPPATAILPETLGQRTSKVSQTPQCALPERFIFAPFQVPSDMQITRLSPWIPDMTAFHTALCAAAEANPDVHFVIKEHPSFRRSIQSHITPHPRVSFHNAQATPDLIRKSQAVVTINSTVGIEALVLDKPVIVLGDAIYGIEDLVLLCPNQTALNNAVAAAPDWSCDATLRDRFLRYIRTNFLIEGNLEAPHPRTAEQLANRAAQGITHAEASVQR